MTHQLPAPYSTRVPARSRALCIHRLRLSSPHKTASSIRGRRHRSCKMRNSRRQTTPCTWITLMFACRNITVDFSGSTFHLAIVSGVGELPTSWLPQTQIMGMAGSSLLYTFFRSASCRARISGCLSPKASTRSPHTTKNAGLGCMLLRISTLFLHNSTLDS